MSESKDLAVQVIDGSHAALVQGPQISGVPAQQVDEDLEIPADMHPDLQLLRTQQQYALQALAEGKSVSEAARIAVVDRTTLYRWMKRDEAFMAALKAWRSRARRGARDRLHSMLEKAMGCLDNALDEKNLPAALAVLKGMGLMAGQAGTDRATTGGRPQRGLSAAVRARMIAELREMLLSLGLAPLPPMPALMDAPAAEPAPETPSVSDSDPK